MARRKRMFVPAELKSTKGRNGEVWHIEYSYRCAKTDTMIRKRISKPFKNLDSKQRLVAARPIITEINDKLKSGWTPEEDEQDVYVDNLEYHQTAIIYGRKKRANRTLRKCVSEFIETKSGLEEETIKTYTSRFRRINSWVVSMKYDELDISAFDNEKIKEFFEYLKGQGLDATTVAHYNKTFRSFFIWAEKKYKLKENPVYDIDLPKKTTDYAARPILQHDLNQVLDLIEKGDQQLYLACLFQYYTMIRPGKELRLLKIGNIDFHNNRLIVIEEDAKKQQRIVDVPKALIDLCIKKYKLHTYDRESYVFSKLGIPGTIPYSKNYMRVKFNQYRDALNLPKHYKFYSFKHTGGGKLLDSGATLEELRDQMGHKEIATTHKYAKKHFGNRNKRVIENFPPPRST